MNLKLIKDVLLNPDNSTYSSKRVGGFLSLTFTIVFGFLALNQPMLIMAGLTTAFFGLATLDYQSFLGNKPKPDPETPVNP